MSHIFRIHKTGIVQVKDWDKSKALGNEDINSIPDTIHQGSAAKLGSSIPSPFARMYLFDTAFKMVNQSASVGNTMYHQLVSDCLDMFQFLYLFADSPHVTFKVWDKETQLKGMEASAFKEHRSLGKALELFFKTKKFKSLSRIILIYYKNKLVGGTSPITVLYTTPNWQRLIDENNWNSEFKTSGTDILFDQVPYAIHQRDDDFIKYMFRFVYAHNDKLSAQSEAFLKYFDKIRRENSRIDDLLIENSIDPDYTAAQFLKDYSPIKIAPSDDTSKDVLYSGECAILKPKREETISLIQKSDFIIKYTVSYFKDQKDEKGQSLGIPRPLVLIKGNHKLNYIDKAWDERTVVPDVPGIALNKRKLPDNNYTYPYLTTGDFLEDALIDTGFNINENKFFTGFQGNFNFLLPIKKEYFNFFTLGDLKKQLTIFQNGDLVKVELNIPIANQRHIEFSRTYDRNNPEQVIKQSGIKGFNLGIFPLYKITDKSEYNAYSIALVSNVEDIRLQFYRYTYLSDNTPVRVADTTRTKMSRTVIGSRYYSIDEEAFDFIEASVGAIIGVKGLIIPTFREVKLEGAYQKYTVAVDFGTTNTHVAYTTTGVKLDDLGIEEKDRQMVLLSALKPGKKKLHEQVIDGFGPLRAFAETFDREFVPGFIGGDNLISYPHRTAICEHNSYTLGAPKLFDNINIGYYLEFDPNVQIGAEYTYQTDLKWGMDNNRRGKEKERVEMYLRETLWLIKNKILLNDGHLKPTIIWMVPLSMKRRIRDIFNTIWKEQLEAVFGKNHGIELKMKYESIVAYYGLEKQGAKIGRSPDVINIDIGGGTTDVFFFYKGKSLFYNTSFRFAGNDLWGEGLSERIRKDNGFLQMMDESIKADREAYSKNQPETLSIYDGFMGTPERNSADICSLLFKYDKEFKFSDHIKNHEPLSSLLLLHLSAILYHLAQIIKAKSLELPQFIAFTGKGSEYIKLISRDERDIYELVSTLLEVFSGQKMPVKSKVIMVNHPKQLTAEGAILHEFSDERIEIDSLTQDLVHLGFEAIGNSDPLNPMLIEKIGEIEAGVKAQFDDFLKQMRDTNISRLMRKLEISFRFGDTDVLSELEKLAVLSYREIIYRMEQDADKNDEIEESPFFWFLKDSLYMLSQELRALKP